MSGHIRQGPSGERIPVFVGAEFDVLISLYHRDGHGPADAEGPGPLPLGL